MTERQMLYTNAIERLTAYALLRPRTERGAWLLELECSLSQAGKDGFAVAMRVADKLIALAAHREVRND